MSAHFNMPEFDHKAFSKYLTENKLTPFSNINSLIENINEIGMFHDPVGYKKPEPNPKDQIYTKKFKSDGVYDIFKNGEKIKTITGGEGEANAYINKLQRELEEAVPFEKDALDEELTVADINKKWTEMSKQNPAITFKDVANALNTTEREIAKALFKSSMGIKEGEEELEEMANFFMVTQDQKDKIDPNKYSGTKKLVAQALKGDEIEVGQPFTKATIKNILGKDPLKDFNAVLDSEEIGGMGKTADVRPQEPKTPGVRGRKPGEKTEKEPTTKSRTDKVVGVKDIDGPRPADVTAAEKELGGAKGIDRTIAIDKAGKAIIDKLKNSKEQLKDPKFKEAKRLAFIAYLTRPKADGGKIGLRKGGETYTNLLNVWDNTVEDLIS